MSFEHPLFLSSSLLLMSYSPTLEMQAEHARSQALDKWRYYCFGAVIFKQRQLIMMCGTAASSVQCFVSVQLYFIISAG